VRPNLIDWLIVLLKWLILGCLLLSVMPPVLCTRTWSHARAGHRWRGLHRLACCPSAVERLLQSHYSGAFSQLPVNLVSLWVSKHLLLPFGVLQDNLSRGNIGAIKVLQNLFPETGRLQFVQADLGNPKAVSWCLPYLNFSNSSLPTGRAFQIMMDSTIQRFRFL
jgi:hypothetical protein